LSDTFSINFSVIFGDIMTCDKLDNNICHLGTFRSGKPEVPVSTFEEATEFST